MPCCKISDCAQMSKTIIAVRHFGLGGRESLETAVIDSITKFATLNQNIVYCNVYCIIGIFRNLAGNFEHKSKTRSITESIKICRFKTFWVEYFA